MFEGLYLLLKKMHITLFLFIFESLNEETFKFLLTDSISKTTVPL